MKKHILSFFLIVCHLISILLIEAYCISSIVWFYDWSQNGNIVLVLLVVFVLTMHYYFASVMHNKRQITCYAIIILTVFDIGITAFALLTLFILSQYTSIFSQSAAFYAIFAQMAILLVRIVNSIFVYIKKSN